MRQAQKYPYFDEETFVDVVNARLRENMTAVVKHQHSAVTAREQTHDEWKAAITLLTDTGPLCMEWRQASILLSDVLGVSMLVDSTSRRRSSGAIETTVLGPFDVPGAPRRRRRARPPVC